MLSTRRCAPFSFLLPYSLTYRVSIEQDDIKALCDVLASFPNITSLVLGNVELASTDNKLSDEDRRSIHMRMLAKSEAELLYDKKEPPTSALFAFHHPSLLVLLDFLQQSSVLQFAWMRNYGYSCRWTRRHRFEDFHVDSYQSMIW
jgi:hypothetical protein